jgi:thiol:disulfide interchange protein DsbD
LKVCSRLFLAALLLAGAATVSGAQTFSSGLRAATVLPGPLVKLKPGETIEVPVSIQIRPAYHINSSQPADEYLIPTALTWEPSGLDLKQTDYPEPEFVSYPFSSQPVSVYSNKIVIVSRFAVPDNAPALTQLKGRLRYQACNSKACFPPTSTDVTVAVAVP